jgi:hypothetical protein
VLLQYTRGRLPDYRASHPTYHFEDAKCNETLVLFTVLQPTAFSVYTSYSLQFLLFTGTIFYQYYMVQILSSIFTTYIRQLLLFRVPKFCFFSLQLMHSTAPVYSFDYLQILKFMSSAVYRLNFFN